MDLMYKSLFNLPFSYDLDIICRFSGEKIRKIKLLHTLKDYFGITSTLVQVN
jgi:hypothetical protein